MFPDPDKFNLHRDTPPEKNLAYGYGDHRCVSEGLARAELEAVFCELKNAAQNVILTHADIHIACLFQRLPNLRLAIPHDQVKYSEPHMDVGIVELPVVW